MLTNIPRVVILGYNLRNHHGSLITIFLCMFFFCCWGWVCEKMDGDRKGGICGVGREGGKIKVTVARDRCVKKWIDKEKFLE